MRDRNRLVDEHERALADLATLEAEDQGAVSAEEAELAQLVVDARLGVLDPAERDRRLVEIETARQERRRSVESARRAMPELQRRIARLDAEIQREALAAAEATLVEVERERLRLGSRVSEAESVLLDRLEAQAALRARRDEVAELVRGLGGQPEAQLIDEPEWRDPSRLIELLSLGPDRPRERAAREAAEADRVRQAQEREQVEWALQGGPGRDRLLPPGLRERVETERARRDRSRQRAA